MEKVVLHATHRTVTGKQVKALRREGKLPGVLYGHHVDPMPITLDLRSASRSLANLTSSSLVNIELDGKEHATLVREKQRDFVRGNLLHVDFQVVSLTEKIHAPVGLELVGLAPAVKDFNGVIINGLTELDVECFPQDLPERITIDLSKLNRIGDGIYVRDIDVNEKVRFLNNLDEMIVIVTGGTGEEVVEEPAAAIEPEVIEKGKKEEEEEE